MKKAIIAVLLIFSSLTAIVQGQIIRNADQSLLYTVTPAGVVKNRNNKIVAYIQDDVVKDYRHSPIAYIQGNAVFDKYQGVLFVLHDSAIAEIAQGRILGYIDKGKILNSKRSIVAYYKGIKPMWVVIIYYLSLKL